MKAVFGFQNSNALLLLSIIELRLVRGQKHIAKKKTAVMFLLAMVIMIKRTRCLIFLLLLFQS